MERDYFHWVTARAVSELADEGRVGREQRKLTMGTPVSFLFDPGLRYRRRIIQRKQKVLEEYARAASGTVRIGTHAENLFLVGFMERGYVCGGRGVRKYGGKEWTASGHDLDFVLLGDGGPWGCEVKNRMDYIERRELEVKLNMCKFLGLRPMFIMRWAPKTYIEQVRRRGGYTMVFGTQVWPTGQEGLVKRVREWLGLPVDCPSSIPGGIYERWARWLAKKGLI